MRFRFLPAEVHGRSRLSHFLAGFSKRRKKRSGDPPQGDAKRRRARMRRFLSYYRPHLPLLAADLACALLVAADGLYAAMHGVQASI